MEENNDFKDRRLADPYTDRRSGEDRRQVYDSDYWEKVGTERRSMKDRRQQKERRGACVKVSKWSSVCVENKTDHRSLFTSSRESYNSILGWCKELTDENEDIHSFGLSVQFL